MLKSIIGLSYRSWIYKNKQLVQFSILSTRNIRKNHADTFEGKRIFRWDNRGSQSRPCKHVLDLLVSLAKGTLRWTFPVQHLTVHWWFCQITKFLQNCNHLQVWLNLTPCFCDQPRYNWENNCIAYLYYYQDTCLPSIQRKVCKAGKYFDPMLVSIPKSAWIFLRPHKRCYLI